MVFAVRPLLALLLAVTLPVTATAAVIGLPCCDDSAHSDHADRADAPATSAADELPCHAAAPQAAEAAPEPVADHGCNCSCGSHCAASALSHGLTGALPPQTAPAAKSRIGTALPPGALQEPFGMPPLRPPATA